MHRAIENADCIINVGHDVIEKPPFFMRRGLRTVIHVNYSSAEVDTVYFPQIEVIGDIANAIWRLKQSIEPQKHWDFAYFDKVRENLVGPPRARRRRRALPDLPRAHGRARSAS